MDCGIVAFEAAAKARELGVDLIVTDHHQPGKVRPAALAVVNPHCEGSQYPFKELSGVGVAFKAASALVRKLGVPETSFRVRFLDLVALGTTVDCMPLLNENRVLVKFGLEALAKRVDPRKTFIGRQGDYRKYAFDVGYPDYEPTPEARKWFTRARELGFHVGAHFNSMCVSQMFPDLIKQLEPGFQRTGTDAAGKANRLSEDSVEIDVRRAALRTLRKGIADRAGVAGRHTEIQIREVLCTTARVIAEVAVTGVRIVN